MPCAAKWMTRRGEEREVTRKRNNEFNWADRSRQLRRRLIESSIYSRQIAAKKNRQQTIILMYETFAKLFQWRSMTPRKQSSYIRNYFPRTRKGGNGSCERMEISCKNNATHIQSESDSFFVDSTQSTLLWLRFRFVSRSHAIYLVKYQK